MPRPAHYASRQKDLLNNRQREVVRLIAQGKTNFQIAEALGISIDGAKWHVREILARLECNSREDIAAWWRAEHRADVRIVRALRAVLPFSGLKLALAAGASAIVVGGVVASVLVVDTGGTAPAAATNSATATATPPLPTPSPTPDATKAQIQLRQPTVANPLAIWIGGDSNAFSLGEAFQQFAATVPTVAVTPDAHVSTGITRPDYYDWAPEIRHVAATKPDIMIVMLSENDWQGMTNADGSVFNATAGSPAWKAEYARRVVSLMTTMEAPGRLVLWVGQPIMEDAQFDDDMQQLNTIVRQAAENHPGVRFVDTRALFADASGNWAESLPAGPDGTMEPMRIGADGVHFSAQGAARLAAALGQVIDDVSGLALFPANS